MDNLKLTVPMVLLGAADVIRKRGWCRLHEEAPDGRVCLLGAINRFLVDHKAPGNWRIADAIVRVTQEIWTLPSGVGRPSATAWNDRHCTSAEQAIAVLERAAAIG